jgi:outer membrane receptor protein involved in Fe transport
MASPFSNFTNSSFQPYDYYSASGQGAPSQAAVNTVFGDQVCTTATGARIACVSATVPGGGGFFFNDNGTLFTRSASCYVPTSTATTCTSAPQGAVPGTTRYFGPQSYLGNTSGNSPANPQEIACQWAQNQPNTIYPDRSCAPSLSSTDWERWLGGPREAYNLFGSAKYELNDRLRAFSTVSFSTSTTNTRREASPASGGFAAQIPYNSNPNARYLPSIAQTDVVRNGVVIRRAGDTLPEYVSVAQGGTNTRGTNCNATGGCTMQQAFPVSPELAALLNSRVAGTRAALGSNNNANTNPFQGLSSCINYARNTNTGTPAGAGPVFVNPTTGVAVTYQIDPNTGQPVYTCGPNASWAFNSRFDFIPPRGTINTQRTWSLSAGLEGDLPFSDWTWEAYTSKGQGQTNTEFQGFVSLYNYRLIMSQPNYGKGYTNNAGSAKILTCTSGLSPFSSEPVSQDCIDAVASNQMDRSGTDQRVHELSAQGHLFDLPAGEARAAVGASYRKNTFYYTPDSLRERDYVNDTSAGQFGIGEIGAGVSVKEIYGELLIPILRDLPLVQNLELELGGRWSKYSTGQGVPTWKALLSWQPVSWLRARGGYNRAERAPNIAELYTRDSANASGSSADPCIVPTATTVAQVLSGVSSTPLAVLNDPANPNQAKLQALCAAMINAAGGTGNSEFDIDPNNFGRTTAYSSGITIVSGNPNLESEKGQTWTAGIVVNSPFSHPLASRLSATVDWYEARIDDPIEIISGGTLSWACFNAYGENPNYDYNDPNGYCDQFQRDPAVGNILFAQTPYLNRGKLVMRGLDASVNWSATMADLGLASLPGRLSIGINANFLFDQIQAIAAGGTTRDYAGIGGAAPFRSSTNVGYSWGVNRVSVNWQYRSGTCIARFGATGCDDTRSRYPVTNTFTVTGGTRIGPVNASLSISNPLNKAPRSGTYDWDDPYKAYGTFNPYDDLAGRRYSLNLSMDF